MPFAAGAKLGPYEILAPLGAGGMGEVYRAHDARLGREVAVKVLPPEFSISADRLSRFEQEARSASALNHPNIITVYDIGSAGDTSYIAMEFVEGKTLREMLGPGAIPLRKAVSIAVQFSDGLAKAHEAGIVHRDLKPENLMLWIFLNDRGKCITESADSGPGTVDHRAVSSERAARTLCLYARSCA